LLLLPVVAAAVECSLPLAVIEVNVVAFVGFVTFVSPLAWPTFRSSSVFVSCLLCLRVALSLCLSVSLSDCLLVCLGLRFIWKIVVIMIARL